MIHFGAPFPTLRLLIAIAWTIGMVASVLRFFPLAPPTVDVLIWTSGEKQNVMGPALERFNAQHVTVDDGGRRWVIRARSVTVNSGPMVDYLDRKLRFGIEFPAATGGAPTVVSPSTSDWLAQVNLDVGHPLFDLAAAKPIVRTPVVIFTYRAMAECLGWPQQPIGWGDIIALSENPDGWASCPTAQAEWGRKPLIAFTDPAVSSAARSTLQILNVVASGKPAEDFTPEDVDDPQVRDFVRRFQATVDHYYPETLKLQTKMFDGPRFVHFAFVEEYNIPWLYQGRLNAESVACGSATHVPIGYDVVAIYPKEGTVWHDDPFAVPDAPWVSSEQRAAAQVVATYLRSDDVQRQFVDWGFRPGTDLPLTPTQGVLPDQPTHVIGRLSPQAAEAIQRSWEDVKKPGVAVLALDTSAALSAAPLAASVKQEAEAFIDSAASGTHVGLLAFSSTVQTQVPIGPLTPAQKFALSGAAESLHPVGSTALYDAVEAAVTMADSYDGLAGDAIRGVVLITTGRANAGIALSDLLTVQDPQGHAVRVGLEADEALKGLIGADLAMPTSHPVHIFSFGVGDNPDREALRLLAEASGGVVADACSGDFPPFWRYF